MKDRIHIRVTCQDCDAALEAYLEGEDKLRHACEALDNMKTELAKHLNSNCEYPHEEPKS
ncbi:MAG: hypothetical protein V3V96_15545 [Acidiferrobacterales bacterium]